MGIFFMVSGSVMDGAVTPHVITKLPASLSKLLLMTLVSLTDAASV